MASKLVSHQLQFLAITSDVILWQHFFFFLFKFFFLITENYDNTLTGDLENTEQSYIEFHYILQLFF